MAATLTIIGVAPILWHWHVSVISSDSMSPSLTTGDVLVSRPVDATDLTAGHVLVVDDPDRPGRLRAHRMVRFLEDGQLLLKGDANGAPDSTGVNPAHVRGAGLLVVPYIGSPKVWLMDGAWSRLAAASVLLITAGTCLDLDRRPVPHGPRDHLSTRRRWWPRPRRRRAVASGPRRGATVRCLALLGALALAGVLILVQDSAAAFARTTTGRAIVRAGYFAYDAAVISRFAGTGVAGYNGDSRPATTAQLAYPSALARDAAGNIYVADNDNHRVRRITPGGVITTVAGTGKDGYNGDNRAATTADLNQPLGVAVDQATGSLYIAEGKGGRIRRVSNAGIISTVAGNGTDVTSGDGGPATSATFNHPRAVSVGPGGVLYVVEYYGHRVRRFTPGGTITTVVGTGATTPLGDNGQATAATLFNPRDVALDTAGNLYIADTDHHRVRRVSISDGRIATVAGTGVAGFSGDGGPATGARLNEPKGVAVSPQDVLFISDSNNHRIRRVVPDGTISTIAGNGVAASTGDGGVGTSASLEDPRGLVERGGALYIAELGHVIRRLQR